MLASAAQAHATATRILGRDDAERLVALVEDAGATARVAVGFPPG